MVKKTLQIVSPIGEVPSTDKDLRDRISKLPKDAKVSEIFREVGEWEKIALKNFKKQEQTKKSGKLGIKYT